LSLSSEKLVSKSAFKWVKLYRYTPELLLFCFAYSLAGTITTTKFFGSKLMGLHFQALRREADLRFGLVRAREHAESIALYRGAAREAGAARAALASVAAVLLKRVAWSRNLALFTNAYEFATFCLPSLIIAPRYFAGEVEFGVVTQAGYAFRTVQGALNLIVGRFEQLSGLAAETERLERLLELLEGLEPGVGGVNSGGGMGGGGGGAGGAKDVDKKEIELTVRGEGSNVSVTKRFSSVIKRSEMPSDGGAGLLRLEKVSIRTPISGRELWSDLSLVLNEGDSVLVIGPSGCGKSSLLRAVAGVWTSGEGHIAAPPHDDTLFLPQSPYMPLGSMRAQLLFPASAGEPEDTGRDIGGGGTAADGATEFNASFDDEELLTALDAAGLGELPERFAHDGGLNARVEWADVLSAGEQQRVAFARLFLRRPACAFIDEATSALDERGESAMYALLKRHVRGIVSVGHRSTLMKYHSHVLRFVPAAEKETGEGGVGGGGAATWVLDRMEDYKRSGNGSLHMF
jgi:putative ATP-binding cassette transporter